MIKYLFLIVCAVCCGCANSYQRVTLVDPAKAVEPDTVRIVVARQGNLIFANGVGVNVVEDGGIVGSVGPDGYLMWQRPPGSFTLTTDAENDDVLPLTGKGGETLCVLMTVDAGWLIYRSTMISVDSGNLGKFLKTYKAPMPYVPPPPYKGTPRDVGQKRP